MARIFNYLSTYGNLAKNTEYYTFYAETLVKLDNLGIDGTVVTSGEELGQRIQKEWETLIIDHTNSTAPMVRRMIDTLLSQNASPKLCTLVQGFSCYTSMIWLTNG